MQKNILRYALVLGFSLIVSSCISTENEKFFGTTKPKHDPNVLWINNGSEPQYMDPQKASGAPDGEIVRNMFGRLTEINPKTGKPIADMAERWEISEDGTEFTFYMRKGLQWSDGKPLTAHDVEYSWLRLLDPETASVYASLAFDIVNGDAYNLGAIFVQGQGLSVEKIQDTLSALDLGDIKQSKYPAGFMVYPEGSDKDAVRKAILKKVNEEKVLGAEVTAEPAAKKHVQAKALDDERFWVKLNGPLPYFLAMIEFYIFAIVPEHVIEKIKARDGDDSLWVRPENVVCNYAYCLEEEAFRQYKIFKKNPLFWDAKNVTLDTVKAYSIESGNTNIFMYRTGEVDWTGANTDVPLEYIKKLKHLEDFHIDPYLGVYFYGFNVNSKPLDDSRVRRALSKAVDRKALSEILGGGEIPFADMVMDGLAGYKSLGTPLFEPKEAKRLLAEAGFPDGKGFPRLELVYNTQEKHKQIGQAVQQMWKENLNIEIELVNKEWKVYLDDMTGRNYDIIRRGWIGDFIDPYTFLELALSTSGNNRTGWKNAKYDKLIRNANIMSDYDKRLEMMREAEKIHAQEMPFMPLFLYTRNHIKKPYLKGFYFDYQGHHHWRYMYIDERYYDGKYHKELPEEEDPLRRSPVWPPSEETTTITLDEIKGSKSASVNVTQINKVGS
ncbi:peptide ABC transporter substrate-binding protein [bacterium]|nr:peptide ABC transporter substrate-binding protein [bacterium]